MTSHCEDIHMECEGESHTWWNESDVHQYEETVPCFQLSVSLRGAAAGEKSYETKPLLKSL